MELMGECMGSCDILMDEGVLVVHVLHKLYSLRIHMGHVSVLHVRIH